MVYALLRGGKRPGGGSAHLSLSVLALVEQGWAGWGRLGGEDMDFL